MKKLLIIVIVLATTVIISLSVHASNNSQNAAAIDNLGATSGKAICYSQYAICESMRCLRCVTCDYVAGIGVTRGGYCKNVTVSTPVSSTGNTTEKLL